MDRLTQFQQSLTYLIAGQLVNRPQPSVAQMVDIIHLASVVAEIQDVFDRVQKVLRSKRHFTFIDLLIKLPIEPKSAYLSQTIAVRVKKLFREEGLGLLGIGRISGPQAHIKLQGGLFVTLAVVHRQGVEDNGILDFRDNLERLNPALLDDGNLVGQLGPGLHNEFTCFGIDDGPHRPHGGCQLTHRDLFRGIEQPDERLGRAQLRVNGPQKDGGWDLTRLVDLDDHDVLLSHADFNPATAFRDDPAAVQNTVTFFTLYEKVNTRAPVQLTDNDANSAVDDEFTTADHHWDFPQVDRLLGHVFTLRALEPTGELQRVGVGEAKLPAFRGCIVRFL